MPRPIIWIDPDGREHRGAEHGSIGMQYIVIDDTDRGCGRDDCAHVSTQIMVPMDRVTVVE